MIIGSRWQEDCRRRWWLKLAAVISSGEYACCAVDLHRSHSSIACIVELKRTKSMSARRRAFVNQTIVRSNQRVDAC